VAALLALTAVLSAATIQANFRWLTGYPLALAPVRRSPGFYRPLVGLGSLSLARGSVRQALHIFEQAYKDEACSSVAYGLGLAHWELGGLDQARFRLEEAAASGDMLEAISDLGILYDQLGQYERALREYGRALRIEPDAPGTYCTMGSTYVKMGEYGKAEAAYRKALELAPGFPLANMGLAGCMYEQQRWQEAETLLQQITASGRASAETHACLGIVQMRRNKVVEAEVQLREAEALGDPTWRMWLLRGLLAEHNGRDEDAAEFYREALKANPLAKSARERLDALGRGDRVPEARNANSEPSAGPERE